MGVWIVILSFLLFFLFWILLSPVVFEIDTRLPRATLQWTGIGNAWIWYDEEWWFSFRILFYQKEILLSEIKRKNKSEKNREKSQRPKKNRIWLFKKIIKVIRSFKIKEWQVGIDTGDFVRNAQLYPINFVPTTFRHLYVNFHGDTFLFIRIQNNVWRIIYSLIR